jgi:hypothetical protein
MGPEEKSTSVSQDFVKHICSRKSTPLISIILALSLKREEKMRYIPHLGDSTIL